MIYAILENRNCKEREIYQYNAKYKQNDMIGGYG